ncbi:MAG: CRISPR-associated helicase Cas3' [Parachlamydiaceae bacterium]
MKKLFAHVKQDENGLWREHNLVKHLRDVAARASVFADKFDSGEWASIAGLWHDLGKFSDEFQHYLKCKSNYDPDAHLETSPGKVNHSSAGALFAMQQFGKIGRLFAYLIAGHHAGLPDWSSTIAGGASLSIRLQDTELLQKALQEEIPQEIKNLALPSLKFKLSLRHLWIRMLFSCLVDADFLDTEFFMDPSRTALRSVYPSLHSLKNKFDAFMAKKIESSSDSIVNACRKNILNQCIAKGAYPPGIFTLTVPTGGGKTLSSLAFALEHAIKYNKERIIYVIPYTSIIEQTTEIYREIFNEGVIEHHSNIDPEKETASSRIAAENWDTPIIVTTNVQFFESLFAARSSRTRKLHNIVNSIVIFDEAQQFPPDFLKPITSTIQELSENYKTTCVLATATQPALSQNQTNENLFKGLKNVTEIIDDVNAIYNTLKRVQINLPLDLNQPVAWHDLATKLQEHKQVLCIVNSRRDCHELFQMMPEGTIHLSALMCGEHRSKVIQTIKILLKKGESVRVISTQLVEAGVDIDFPIVFRALAGIDSISQAAGRCNREGKLTLGQVHVFVPPKPAPIGNLRKAECISKELLKTVKVDPLDPGIFKKYFERLFESTNTLDKENIHDLLTKNQASLEFEFRTAAAKFKLIDDAATAPVLVNYGDSISIINLLEKRNPLSRTLSRKMQRYIVNLPKGTHQKLLAERKIREIPETGIFVQSINSLYDDVRGFTGGFQEYLGQEDFIIS